MKTGVWWDLKTCIGSPTAIVINGPKQYQNLVRILSAFDLSLAVSIPRPASKLQRPGKLSGPPGELIQNQTRFLGNVLVA